MSRTGRSLKLAGTACCLCLRFHTIECALQSDPAIHQTLLATRLGFRHGDCRLKAPVGSQVEATATAGCPYRRKCRQVCSGHAVTEHSFKASSQRYNSNNKLTNQWNRSWSSTRASSQSISKTCRVNQQTESHWQTQRIGASDPACQRALW